MIQQHDRLMPHTKDAAKDRHVGQTQRLFQQDFLLLMVINFMVMTAVTAQMGTLPLYVTQLGGNAMMSGLVIGIWGLAALVARVPVGKMIDRFGRKPLIVIGLLVLVVDFGLLIFSQSLFVLILLRAFQGIGNGTQSTAVATLVADKLPPRQLSIGLGYFSISQTLPAAVGPAIGLLIVNHWGFQAMFYFSLGLVVVALGLTVLVRDTYDVKAQQTTAATSPVGILALLAQVSIWAPSLVVFIAAFANAAVAAFLVQFGFEKGLPLTLVGLSFTVQALVGVLARIWFAKLYLYFHTLTLVGSSIVMIASAYVCIAFSPGIGGFLIAGGLIGLGFALLMPLMNAVVLQDVLPVQRGRATAIFSSGTDVAYGMGAIIWGIFASYFGYFAVYCVAAILVVTTLSLVMRYRHMLRQSV